MTRYLKILALVAALAMFAAACGEGGLDGDTDDDDLAADGADDDGDDGDDVGDDPDNLEEVDIESEGGEAGSTLAESTIVIGSKDFDEQLVLGWISYLLMEDAGADVVDEINLGGTFPARAALENDQIDMYWEYNGTAWIEFFQETEPIDDPTEQYEVVAERDLEENDLVWLAPAQFNNTYALAMNQDRWSELGSPETLTDVGPLLEEDPDLSICVEPEFDVRDDGLPGMEAMYGYAFTNIENMDTGIIYDQTASGNCDFGEVFTTDGRIATLDLVVLEDDMGFFPLYNPSPVFRGEIYEPLADELDELFAPVSEALDEDTMSGLNAEVSSEGREPRDVAQEFLEEIGAIGN